MVEGHVVADDAKQWDLRLRDGLLWHDGERVLVRARTICARKASPWLVERRLAKACNSAHSACVDSNSTADALASSTSAEEILAWHPTNGLRLMTPSCFPVIPPVLAAGSARVLFQGFALLEPILAYGQVRLHRGAGGFGIVSRNRFKDDEMLGLASVQMLRPDPLGLDPAQE